MSKNELFFHKNFKNYSISLISSINSITISIINNNTYKIYESIFNIGYLHRFRLLVLKNNIIEMIKYIYSFLEKKKIKIEENKINLKLILLSPSINYPNVELILNKKNIINNNNINNSKKEINKNQIPNLKIINSINAHENLINSVSIFPSGKIISVSHDKSIKIYDNNFNIIQIIKNAHDNYIINVNIKNENNFITCSSDKSIKFWKKNKNEFQLNQIIENAHNDIIMKVIHFSNNNIISCSKDKTVKIWENINNKYQTISILSHLNKVHSILLLEDKNILISSGKDGTKFWDINFYNCIISFDETWCSFHNSLIRFNNDSIIVKKKNRNSFDIISISEKKIIREIYNMIDCFGLILIKEKNIIIVGGKSKDIRIYNLYNGELIQIIKNAHENSIYGFVQLKNGMIASYSKDNTIKIWSFNNNDL